MKHKIEKLLFILKGKTIGWSPSGDAFNYEKYIFKEKADKKMSKEYLKKQIELLVKDDEISQQTIINQKREIEKLNNKNEELLTLYNTEREVKDDYKAIIKEVRECIDNITLEKLDDFEKYKMTPLKDTLIGESILEILDKGE